MTRTQKGMMRTAGKGAPMIPIFSSFADSDMAAKGGFDVNAREYG